jgi:hypothetical protein
MRRLRDRPGTLADGKIGLKVSSIVIPLLIRGLKATPQTIAALHIVMEPMEKSHLLKNMYCHGRFTDTEKPPAILGEGDSRLLHLPRTRLSPELEHQLVYLCKS